MRKVVKNITNIIFDQHALHQTPHAHNHNFPFFTFSVLESKLLHFLSKEVLRF